MMMPGILWQMCQQSTSSSAPPSGNRPVMASGTRRNATFQPPADIRQGDEQCPPSPALPDKMPRRNRLAHARSGAINAVMARIAAAASACGQSSRQRLWDDKWDRLHGLILLSIRRCVSAESRAQRNGSGDGFCRCRRRCTLRRLRTKLMTSQRRSRESWAAIEDMLPCPYVRM